MQACDWNGHSYSASITRAAVLNASSTLPTGLLVLALAHRRLADVVVERGLVGERRLAVRPFDLELLRGLDRVPFLVGDDREEVVLAHHARARDVLDRAFVDLDRRRARDRRTDHAAHAPCRARFTSVTNGSVQNAFGAMSARWIGLPTILYSLGSFGLALPGA